MSSKDVHGGVEPFAVAVGGMSMVKGTGRGENVVLLHDSENGLQWRNSLSVKWRQAVQAELHALYALMFAARNDGSSRARSGTNVRG